MARHALDRCAIATRTALFAAAPWHDQLGARFTRAILLEIANVATYRCACSIGSAFKAVTSRRGAWRAGLLILQWGKTLIARDVLAEPASVAGAARAPVHRDGGTWSALRTTTFVVALRARHRITTAILIAMLAGTSSNDHCFAWQAAATVWEVAFVTGDERAKPIRPALMAATTIDSYGGA